MKNNKENKPEINFVKIASKILPLSFVASEIDNYIKQNTWDDAIGSIYFLDKDYDTVQYSNDFGYEIANANTYEDRSFALYFNVKYNQFVLVDKNQAKAIFAWNVFPEEASDISQYKNDYPKEDDEEPSVDD